MTEKIKIIACVEVPPIEIQDTQKFFHYGRNGVSKYGGISFEYFGGDRVFLEKQHSRGYVSGGISSIPVEDVDKLCLEWLRARGLLKEVIND